MDSRTLKLLNSIDSYLENPPPGAPEQLMQEISNIREMASAPRFTGESPGERVAREVSESTMPPEVAAEYNNDPTEQPSEDVGVFQHVQ